MHLIFTLSKKTMTELKALLKTTPQYINLLSSHGIKNIKDFFNYFPRTYEDRASIQPLNNLQINEKGTAATKGKIIEKKSLEEAEEQFMILNLRMKTELFEQSRFLILGI